MLLPSSSVEIAKRFTHLVLKPRHQLLNSTSPSFETWNLFHNNSKSKDISKELSRDSTCAFLFFGNYTNLLSIYHGIQKNLHPTPLSSQQLNRLFFAVESSEESDTPFSCSVEKHPNISQMFTMHQLIERTKQQFPQHENKFLIPIHTFLNGIKTAEEYHKIGIYIRPLRFRLFPEFGVYLPTRMDYLSLFEQCITQVLLPQYKQIKHQIQILDIGTGMGVLSFILAKYGFRNIMGTDVSDWAVECAKRQFQIVDSLKPFRKAVSFEIADICNTSEQKYDLIVCNPPWMSSQVVKDSIFDASVFDTNNHDFKKKVMYKAATELLTSNGKLILLVSNLEPNMESIIETYAKQVGLAVNHKLICDAETKKAKQQQPYQLLCYVLQK